MIIDGLFRCVCADITLLEVIARLSDGVGFVIAGFAATVVFTPVPIAPR